MRVVDALLPGVCRFEPLFDGTRLSPLDCWNFVLAPTLRFQVRTTRSVHLTPEGQEFLERSKQLLSDADQLAALFRRDGEKVRGISHGRRSVDEWWIEQLKYLCGNGRNRSRVSAELQDADRQSTIISSH
jgi:hypothetical protein